MEWPTMIPMTQKLDRTRIDNLEGTLREGIKSRLNSATFNAGDSVAIGVGSRGITPLVEVVSTIISELKSAGLKPFIVPAMGSHGGATAAGQKAVLAEYDIVESVIGAEVRATMDVIELGNGPSGQTFFGDALAYQSDHVVVIGRVKPHTDFKADIESGLCKMTSVGLGKQVGAERIHEMGLAEMVPEGAQVAINTNKILMGVALVENAYDEPVHCKVVEATKFHETDRDLLIKAKNILPRLPVDHLHLLVVDEMGKNISGAGMDTNIVGFWRLLSHGPKDPNFQYLATLRLTEESGGNATGIGIADFVSPNLVSSIDYEKTYMNGLTSLGVAASKIPLHLSSDETTLEAAYTAASRIAGRTIPRMMRIKNTMLLEHFWASLPVATELEQNGSATKVGEGEPFSFSNTGELLQLTN